MKKLLGKSFFIKNEKWILEEVLLYGHRCVCRNYQSEEIQQFNCDFVKDRISKYEYDLRELDKDRNSIILREDEEKELLKKIIQYYKSSIKLSDIPIDELDIILRIDKKLNKGV